VRHQALSFLLILSLGPMVLDEPVQTGLRKPHFAPSVEQMIIHEAVEQGVPSHLAILIAYRESRFNPAAFHRKSRCRGLFQLAPLTVQVLRVADPFDARQNAIAGLGLFGNYLRFGGEEYAMCAFANGPQHCFEKRRKP
jgi:soluble lytic murein transglycosylase-like protein